MIRPGESFLARRGTNATPFTTNWVSFFTVDGGDYSPPNRSSGVWVSIANVSTTPSTPAVTTADIVMHNTSASRNYTLLCSSSVDSNQAWWPVYTFAGGGDYTASIIWTNSPNPDPAAWTNSNYGNVLATNVPYSNIGMPSMYFTVQDDGQGNPRPAGGPLGDLTLQIQVPRAYTNTFAPSTNNGAATTQTLAGKDPISGDGIFAFNPNDIYALNLGWSANDYDYWLNQDSSGNSIPVSGTTDPDYRRRLQFANHIYNIGLCTNMTNFYCCNTNFNVNSYTLYGDENSMLDFHGLTSLKDIELYHAQLPGINVTGCSNLWRLCVEACDISGTLDLTGCTSLQDLRGALNHFSDITFPGGTSSAPNANSNLVHICIRSEDVSKLSPTLVSTKIDNSFTGLRELLCWDDGQTGVLNLASTNLTHVQVYNNQFTDINFTNCHNLKWFWAANNNLSSQAMEHILGEIYTNSSNTCCSIFLNGNNCYTTSNGYWFYDQIRKGADSGPNSQWFNIDRPEPNVDLGNGWTLCQSRANQGGNLSFDFPNAQGNLLICYARSITGDFSGTPIIGDTAGNDWTLLQPLPSYRYTNLVSIPYDSGAGTGYLRVYYAKNCKAASGNRVTIQGGASVAMAIAEIAGASTSNPIYTNASMSTIPNYTNGFLLQGFGMDDSGDRTNRMTMVVSTCRVGKMHAGTLPPLYPDLYVPLHDDCGVFGEVVTRATPWQWDSGAWWLAAYGCPLVNDETWNDTYAMMMLSLQH